MKKNTINIGIIGFGTVGTGTVKILLRRRKELEEKLGFPVVLKKVADLDTKTNRGVKLPKGVLDEEELKEILEEETGLGDAAEGQFEKKPRAEEDNGCEALLAKTKKLEEEIASIRSETSFLREKLNEQSDVILELIKLVKVLEK